MSSRFGRIFALALCLAAAAAAAAAADKGGYDEGYRHGFQDGYQQGLEAGRAGPEVRRDGPPRRPPPPLPPPRNILVVQADYGSGGRTCDATARVAARLDGKRAGTIEVGNRLCGDPAPGSRKYLRVLYLCGGEQREVVAFERRALDIRCD
jgi:hypothetical protein